MRILIAICFVLLISGPAFGSSFFLDAGLYPPHNEQVVGDKVARYRISAQGETQWRKLKLEGKFYLFGVNTWLPPSVVGNGLPDAWEGSDFTVEEWRYEFQATAAFPITETVDVFVEHWTQEEFPGHQSYSWLTGFRWHILEGK